MKYMGFEVVKTSRYEKLHTSQKLESIQKIQRKIERLTGVCPQIFVKYIKDKPLFFIKRK